MKNIFRNIPALLFSVSTVFMLLLSCYLGWPAGESGASVAIRTEQVFTDRQMHYNILSCPVFHPEDGLVWEDAAAARCAAAIFSSVAPDNLSL